MHFHDFAFLFNLILSGGFRLCGCCCFFPFLLHISHCVPTPRSLSVTVFFEPPSEQPGELDYFTFSPPSRSYSPSCPHSVYNNIINHSLGLCVFYYPRCHYNPPPLACVFTLYWCWYVCVLLTTGFIFACWFDLFMMAQGYVSLFFFRLSLKGKLVIIVFSPQN